MRRDLTNTSLYFSLFFTSFALLSCGNKAAPSAAVEKDVEESHSDAEMLDDAATLADGSARTPGDSSGANDALPSLQDAGSAPICEVGKPSPLGANFFVDISAASGIQVDNVIHGSAKPIPINDHSRLGFVDLDGDGLDDIVTHSLYPNPQKGIPFEHLIYHNSGDGTFTEVSDQSGLRKVAAGFFAFGDIDNDGDEDCFAGLDIPITGKTHQILLNDGNGVFTPRMNSGVESLPAVAGNAVFADFNGDAKLDLFIGMGHTAFKAPNRLLLGQGDGSFKEASAQLNDPSSQPTNGSLACDYDDDGDLDIFVSNYGVSVASGHNRLLQNNGAGVFKEVGEQSGFAYQKSGNTWLIKQGILKGDEPKPGPTGFIGSNGFGMDCGDINGDGRLDIFATAISHPNAGNYSRTWSDPTQLLIGVDGPGGFAFENRASKLGLPFNEGDVDGSLVDFDNDGRLDLARSRDKKYEQSYSATLQKAWFGLAHQQPDGQLVSVGPVSGINEMAHKDAASMAACAQDGDCQTQGEKCLSKHCRLPCTGDADCTAPDEICHSAGFCKGTLRMKNAQNHAWADVDADGDMDLLVGGRDTGGGRPNFLFRNDVGAKLPWLELRLIGDGVKVNRDAIGARAVVAFKSGDGLLRELKSSRGMHNSMDSRWLHFGLGDRGCDYTVTLRWPDGQTASFTAQQLSPRHHYTITYPDTVSVWKIPGA